MPAMYEGAFRKIIDDEVAKFVAASGALESKLMDNLALLVLNAFELQHCFIHEGLNREQPDDEKLEILTRPTFNVLRQIQQLREENRHVEEYCNHIATVADSIMALNWITYPKTPVQFIKDMKEAGDYFGNRVLTANKGNEKHMTWINKWNAVLTALEEYVKTFHRTGFVWNVLASSDKSNFPEVRPPPPPPPVAGDPCYFGAGDAALAADREALLRNLNQGPGIIKSLKPVSSAPKQRLGATSTTRSALTSVAQKSAVSAPSNPPVFVSEGKKWRIEYQKNVQDLKLDPNDKSESLAMYKCENSFLEIKSKMNAVTIDNCKRCVIVLQGIISSVELIRCEKVEIRCMGSCPNVTLDNCDSVQVFLNDSSANCQVITSKCTSINICRMTDNGDYVEFPVPEQIRSILVNNKLQTTVVEHCM